MIPQEKTEELVNRFDLPTGLMSSERKECALICADEIIKVLDEISLQESGTTKIDYGQSYWQEVKEEIEKL